MCWRRLFGAGFCIMPFLFLHGQEPDPSKDPKIIFRSLLMEQDSFLNATDDEAKTKAARTIIAIGDPLARGILRPVEAKGVAEANRAGGSIPEALQKYRPFWMLRAAAAVQCDNSSAGEEAAKVLKTLGPPNPESSSYIDVMAALNVKGWLTKRTSRPVTTATPASAPSEESTSTDASASEEHTYYGTVGPYDATFNLRFDSGERVSGTYTLSPNRNLVLRLEGTNPKGQLILDEYTHGEHTARINLTRKESATEIRWEGTMYNTPPDNRVFSVAFSRPK
jgi:hypothetical protein